MSYSFSVRAATKTEASAAVAAKLAEVQAAQPVHVEFAHVQAAFDAFVGLLPDDPAKDVIASLSGSTYTVDGALYNVQASVAAFLSPKEPVAA